MPKFGGKLMDEDIWKVVSYIRREQAKSAGISLDIFIASSKEKSAPYMGAILKLEKSCSSLKKSSVVSVTRLVERVVLA